MDGAGEIGEGDQFLDAAQFGAEQLCIFDGNGSLAGDSMQQGLML